MPPSANPRERSKGKTMYYPSLEEVKAMAGKGTLMPVYRSINADLETPVSAYLKVARPPYSFLLESVAGGERLGRYSFIGTEPYRVITTGQGQPDGEVDPLTLVEQDALLYLAGVQAPLFYLLQQLGEESESSLLVGGSRGRRAGDHPRFLVCKTGNF